MELAFLLAGAGVGEVDGGVEGEVVEWGSMGSVGGPSRVGRVPNEEVGEGGVLVGGGCAGLEEGGGRMGEEGGDVSGCGPGGLGEEDVGVSVRLGGGGGFGAMLPASGVGGEVEGGEFG